MPAYNEADCIQKTIAAVREEFDAISLDYEIIVVDDGSTDGTRKNVEALADGKVLRVYGYDVNQGKGHALKIGFREVTGEYTFLMDSDLDIRPKEFLEYVRAMESSDIVIGSKRHPMSVVRTPIPRKFLSLTFNILERLVIQVHASDTQAGLKSARSEALYRILPLLTVKRYAFDAELLAVASLLKFKIRELPVSIELGARFSVKQVFRMMIDLLGIGYRLRIRRWYQENMTAVSDTYKPILPW